MPTLSSESAVALAVADGVQRIDGTLLQFPALLLVTSHQWEMGTGTDTVMVGMNDLDTAADGSPEL